MPVSVPVSVSATLLRELRGEFERVHAYTHVRPHSRLHARTLTSTYIYIDTLTAERRRRTMPLIPLAQHGDFTVLCKAISTAALPAASRSFSSSSPSPSPTDRANGDAAAALLEVCRAALPDDSSLWGVRTATHRSERRKFSDSWLSRVSGASPASIVDELLPSVLKGDKTFISGDQPIAADVITARLITDEMARRASMERVGAKLDVWRWFDLMQNLLQRYGECDRVALIEFPREAVGAELAAKPAAAAEQQQRADAECAARGAEPAERDAAAATLVDEAVKEKQKRKKAEKAAKKQQRDENGSQQQQQQQPASAAANEASAADKPDIARVDIRVGRILSARPHPDADALYVEEIDVGDGGDTDAAAGATAPPPRTVCSGLVKFIPEAQSLVGMCVVVANLKPVNMRGIKSQAMVLCATSPDGDTVRLLQPPAGAKVGERVYFPGTGAERAGVPDAQLNPKKKVFERVAEALRVSDDERCVALYDGVPFTTDSGVCTCTGVRGGTIK